MKRSNYEKLKDRYLDEYIAIEFGIELTAEQRQEVRDSYEFLEFFIPRLLKDYPVIYGALIVLLILLVMFGALFFRAAQYLTL